MAKAKGKRGETGNRLPDDSPYMSVGEVAKEIGYSVKTVQTWIDRGMLPGIRCPGTGKARSHRRVLKTEYRKFRENFDKVNAADESSKGVEVDG